MDAGSEKALKAELNEQLEEIKELENALREKNEKYIIPPLFISLCLLFLTVRIFELETDLEIKNELVEALQNDAEEFGAMTATLNRPCLTSDIAILTL